MKKKIIQYELPKDTEDRLDEFLSNFFFWDRRKGLSKRFIWHLRRFIRDELDYKS